MNDLFQDFIHCKVVVVYLDNILIFSKMLQKYWQVAQEVLQIFCKHKLYFKSENSKYEATKIEYFDMIIFEEQVEMDPVKIKGILEWPIPKCKRDI